MTIKHDDIEIEILDDGRVKVITPGISGTNHKNADELLKFMSQQLGGTVEKTKAKRSHSHSHHNHRVKARQ